jgi:hypothetical protein
MISTRSDDLPRDAELVRAREGVQQRGVATPTDFTAEQQLVYAL